MLQQTAPSTAQYTDVVLQQMSERTPCSLDALTPFFKHAGIFSPYPAQMMLSTVETRSGSQLFRNQVAYIHSALVTLCSDVYIIF